MTPKEEIIKECLRQAESCQYTAVTLFEYVRELRWSRIIFAVTPVVAGALGTWAVLASSPSPNLRIFSGICSILAGLIPAMGVAFRVEISLEEAKNQASEFKNLHDRFRQAALISSKKKDIDFEGEFRVLMERLENARRVPITPPERFFKKAQKKIGSGDYNFAVDQPAPPTPAPPTPAPPTPPALTAGVQSSASSPAAGAPEKV